VADNDFLNHRSANPDGFGYAVFGQVIEGLDVVRKIEKVKTGNRAGHENVPVEPVVINSVRLEPAA
jgi:peptidyl-prolyl cis-trans isomerase B (cyclophilin B)